MNTLHIVIQDGRTAFRPRNELAGTVSWQFQEAPKKMELRLIWFTKGKGTEDVQVVETLPFENLRSNESRPFRFMLPAAPFTFSGKLCSLIWALELVAKPKESRRVEFVMAPGEREIILPQLEDRLAQAKKRWLVLNR